MSSLGGLAPDQLHAGEKEVSSLWSCSFSGYSHLSGKVPLLVSGALYF